VSVAVAEPVADKHAHLRAFLAAETIHESTDHALAWLDSLTPEDEKDPEVATAIDAVNGWATETAEHRAKHPLAHARLWAPRCLQCGEWSPVLKQWDGPEMTWTGVAQVHECPDCGVREARTSQRLAVMRSLYSDADRVFILGGNRTGKSEGAAQVVTAVCLGRDHPDVVSWCNENGIDLALVPERRLPTGPGLGYAVALTSNDSKQYVRPKITRYMPDAAKYYNWNGNGQADAKCNGAAVICKSVDQGRRSMQGAAARVVWPDEEPDGGDTDGIVEELDARLTDFDGWMLFSMTPLRGWTPLLESHVRHPRADVLVLHLDALDNPFVPRHSVLKRLARYGERIRLARQRGVITALEGAVHPEFERANHVVESFTPPKEWPTFGSIDFGTRAPFVHVWAALDQSDGVVHVYREHYQADTLIRDHARAIWDAEGCDECQPHEIGSDAWWRWRMSAASGKTTKDGKVCPECSGSGRSEEEPYVRWADPEGLDSRGTLAHDFDIQTTVARKNRRASFDALDDLIQLDVEGKPHIVFHDCCTNTIREMENLTWDERKKDETAVRGDDHAWDALRYLAYGLRLAGWTQPIRDDDEVALAAR
jgi:hypothetical protein